MTREIFRYLVCGSAAALIALGVRIAFSLAMPFGLATLGAQIVAMIVGYYLYRYIVWAGTTRSVKSTILPFVIVNLASLLIVLLVSITTRMILIGLFGESEIVDTVAHATGIACGAGLSLLGHRTFTFR